MRKRLSYCLFGLSLVAGLSSCVKDVIMDAKEKPQVVVDCVLTDEAEQTLRLSFTKGASLSEAPPLLEASAVLYDLYSDKLKVGEFRHVQGSEWTLEYTPVYGHHYRLEVDVPGYEQMWAEQTMPKPAGLQCWGYNYLSTQIEPWSGWRDRLEPIEGVKGMWELVEWPEEEPYPDYETFYIMHESSSPAWLYAVDYNPVTGEYEQAGEICVDVETDPCNVLDKVYDPPVRDVPNPWKYNSMWTKTESFLEKFYAAHRMELYPGLAGEALHDGFLRFPPSDSKRQFRVSGNFKGEYSRLSDPFDTSHAFFPAVLNGIWGYAIEPVENEGYLLCVTCSAEYDKFLLDAYHFQRIQASTDLSTIFLRENVYSNIVGGGIGIFGAVTRRKFPWARTYVYVDAGVDYHPGIKNYQDVLYPGVSN